jgi:hypothetical protein
MAVGMCLLPDTREKFKQALIAGKIVPEKLAKMTSEERHKLFSDIVGEGNSKFVNSTFEQKTLLKDQQAGYLRWAKKLANVSPETRRDLVNRISKLDKVLDPERERQFLKDLASTKLGLDVTAKEAKQIANMASRVTELETKRRADGTFPSETDRMAYGRAKVEFDSHMAELKNNAAKLSIREQAMHPIQSASKVAGLSKALKASLDNSAIFRQGWKTLATNPRIWQKNARQSFVDIAKQLGGREVLKEINADMVSRPNYSTYQKMKLAIGNTEEEFPTTLPEKIPLFGRVYKASEGAYTGFLYRQRADIADKMLQMAEKSGVDITDKAQLESIGKLINALTGRGHLEQSAGKLDKLNTLFFSPRFIKSNFDTLTAHQLQKGVTPFVRKQAAQNLAKVVALSAGVLTIANFIKPGSVELDPTSKNFGKIKIGHTTFDVTGGMGGMATLVAQIVRNQSKSASSGIITKFGQGYGAKTGLDALNNYFENKTSPVGSIAEDLLRRSDFNGNPLSAKNEAINAFVPLPATTFAQTNSDPQAANAVATLIADGLGLASQTNTPQKNLKNSLTKDDRGLMDKIGDDKFQQYNDEYNRRLNKFTSSDLYKNLPDDKKRSASTTASNTIKDDLYTKYNYKPATTKPDKNFRRSIVNAVK